MFARLFLLLTAATVPLADWLPASPQQRTPRKVAFLVAVGKYDHKFADLGTAPENDVAALAAQLAGFEVVTLTGGKPDDDPHRATKANVEARFKELLKGGNGKPPVRDGDTVLVLLCGHGVQEAAAGTKDDEPFFCPVDARPDDTGTMVPLNALIRATEAFGATSLFLVDACREVPPDANRGTRSGIQGKKVSLPPKTAVLFACGQGQLSHQSDKLDKGHGLFTYAVVKALKGGGRVSWGKLVDDVQAEFQGDDFKVHLPAGRKQSPVLATGEMGFTELIVTKRVEPPTGAETVKSRSGERDEPFEYILDNSPTPKKGTRRVLSVKLGGDVKMDFVFVPSGTFTMGSAEDQANTPRRVEITRGFFLGKFEVTQAEYKAIIGTNPSEDKNDYLPVTNVSWDDAVAFCKAISEKSNQKFTLPTEAEWEYACRAGTTTTYHYGAKADELLMNCSPSHAGVRFNRGETRGATFLANQWGFHDMHGNVWEMCLDDFAAPDRTVTKDPLQTRRHLRGWKVIRGGCHNSEEASCTSSSRTPTVHTVRSNTQGFRVLLRPN